jgi:hypothetical protein
MKTRDYRYDCEKISRIFALFVLALSLSLCACGKKPKLVEAPEGTMEDSFPQTYPMPEDDSL